MQQHKEIRIGDRVRFLRHGEPDPAPLDPGQEGTVNWVSTPSKIFGGKRQVGVDWDNGRTLMLIEGVDDFALIGKETDV